ncbi:MAG: iron-sulfur cluster assembly accessory protein, partial [Armatimonadota bacterium]|nr:iron-sulfur cluster assembly accessory protein [Armatimonadota bacterium]
MITITPSAASKLQELVEQSGAVDVYLRLFVTQGGCEGFSYGMALDTERREDDFVFELHGIRLVVD